MDETRTVTCPTLDCPNQGIPIVVPNNGNTVICGCCASALAEPDAEQQTAWAAAHPEEETS